MSVLPSFKSAFSSFADAEAVRVADDSAFALSQPASTTNSAPTRTSPLQDHLPQRHSNPWSHLQTTPTAPSSLNEQRKPQLTSIPLQPFPPRPPVDPLPLEQLPGDLPRLAFGFVSRSAKHSLLSSEPRPSIPDPSHFDHIPFNSPDSYEIRTESLKRTHSPSVHAGAYKRPRSQSISAGGAYVKSQSSSERHSKKHSSSSAPRDLSASAGRQTPVDRLSSASARGSHSPATSRRDSVKVPGLLSSTTITRQTATITKQTSTNTYVRPTTMGMSLPRPPSMSREVGDLPTQYARRDGASASASGVHEHKTCASPKASAGHRVSPTPSTVAPGNERTNSSIRYPTTGKNSNLVSFAAPSLSHPSGGSKGMSNAYNARILAGDDIIEDSTCRVAVDVLGSPRQRSMNSTLTGRTGLLRGALLNGFTMSRGPTASDLSVLLGSTRQDRGDRDERSATIDESTTAGISERQKQSMTTSDSVIGSDGEQVGHKSDSGDRMNLSSIVKSESVGDGNDEREQKQTRDKMAGSRVKVTGSMVNRTIQTGNGKKRNLWGGHGVDIDGSGWNMNGDSSGEQGRVEAWRQEPKAESKLAKSEEGANEMNNGVGNRTRNGMAKVERLWGGEYCGTEVGAEGGSGTGGNGMTSSLNGTDEWSEIEGKDVVNGQGRDGYFGDVRENEEKEKKAVRSKDKSVEDGESVQCPHCERRLRNAVTLQNHVRVVHDHSGNFRCDQCPATFMWRSTLGNHVRLVHEKQRPFGCDQCSKAFRWKSHLQEHTWVVHMGEKPFRCETCGKRFGRKNNMQKHVKKHSESGL